MHLLKLEGLLKLTGNSADVKNPMSVQHYLPDLKVSKDFLQFPFSDTGIQLNSAGQDLFLLIICGSSSKKESTMLYRHLLRTVVHSKMCCLCIFDFKK